MNLRIAYYVVAFAISLAAFAGAYGYANDASAAALVATFCATHSAAYEEARYAADDKAAADAKSAYVTAYGFASAVSLAAFAGAYILSNRSNA